MDAMSPFERQLTTLHPELVMWQYKINPCPSPHGHSAEDCVWAHPEDHHRRRSPHLYTAEYCKFMRSKHVCCAGDTCPKAHTLLEYRLHPARFRTERCRYGTRAQCPNAVCFFAHTDAELRPAPPPAPPLMGLDGSGLVAAAAPVGLQAWCTPAPLQQGHVQLGGAGGSFAPALQQQEPQLLFQQFPQLSMAPQQQQQQQQQYPVMSAGNNMVVLGANAALQMPRGGQGLLLPSSSAAVACMPADAAIGGGAYMPGVAGMQPQMAAPQAFVPTANGNGQMLLVMSTQAPGCCGPAPTHPLPLAGLGTTPMSVLQQQQLSYQQLPVTLARGIPSLAQPAASGPQLLQGAAALSAPPLLVGGPLPLQQQQHGLMGDLQGAGAAWGTHPAHLRGLAASSALGASVLAAQGESASPLAGAQLPAASAMGAAAVHIVGGSAGVFSSGIQQAPDGERLGDVLQMMLAQFKPSELRSLHASLGQSLGQKDGLVV